MSQQSLMRIENILLHRGGAKVLGIREMHVRQGRILALIGPNGAGKSTLLLILAGLLKPEQGRIYFQDKVVQNRTDLEFLRRHVSVVFQEPLLLNSNVFENVALGLKFRKIDKKEISSRVHRALDYFGIRHLKKDPPELFPVVRPDVYLWRGLLPFSRRLFYWMRHSMLSIRPRGR